MASNLNIDVQLLNEALCVSGKKTKRETVDEALLEYIQRSKQKQTLSLFGKIDFAAGYSHKKLRTRH